MAKIVSETERQLQKKLIPLNIFVCLLALVAAVTLFIMPLFNVNVVKVAGNEAVVQIIEEAFDKMVSESEELPEGEADYKPAISTAVEKVLSGADGKITFTAFSSLKVAIAKENRTDKLMDELGDNGLLNELIDGVSQGVADAYGSDAELGARLNTALHTALDQRINGHWYLFLIPLAFIVPWAVLFLFAFFHMLAKNKRFTMWYVKIFGILPCLIFGILPLVAPKLLPLIHIAVIEQFSGLVLGLLGGISTMTWISGGCYVVLWIVSIFWAFPIKRKIRKVRKDADKGVYSYEEPAKGGKKKRGKRGKEAPEGGYGSPYGGGYGSDYGSPYGGGYGSDYGSPYGGGYGSDYGSPYGGGYYDDGGFDEDYDFDSFGLPPYDSYGSSYGGFYDDDDDDF